MRWTIRSTSPREATDLFRVLPTSWADALMRRIAFLTPKVLEGRQPARLTAGQQRN